MAGARRRGLLWLALVSAGAVSTAAALQAAAPARAPGNGASVAGGAAVGYAPARPAVPAGLGTGSPETVVAVVDTGVDVSRPALEHAVLPGYDAVDGSRDVSDGVGHGTFVAELAVGGAGACLRCRLLPVKVASDGTTTGARLARGIEWAVSHGAAVINVSLVLGGPDPRVRAAVADALGRGVVVVAAAGNEGGDRATYPAAYPGVVGVAAAGPDGALYPWATAGRWAALAAPGCAAVAAARGASDFCGSSAAAALVSGVAGLLRSVGLTASQTVAALRADTEHEGSGTVGVLDERELDSTVRRSEAARLRGS